MKTLTRRQLEARKAKAVRFLRDVKGDEARADEVEDESLESYAARRRVQLLNPSKRGTAMAPESRADLKRKIRELEEENDELQQKLDDIADVVAPEEEPEEEEDEEGGEEED